MMLTRLEKRILDLMQEPLKICRKPFAVMARRAHCTPERCIQIVQDLKDKGYIRRYSAFVNYAVLGRRSVLVAAAVPPKKLKRVITAVNSLEGVSHHYLRNHVFNVWFTLQDTSHRKIQNTLFRLNRKTGVRFYIAPAEKVFKLDARFCSGGPSQKDFRPGRFRTPESFSGRVSLNTGERKVIQLLQKDMALAETPFEVLSARSGIRDVEKIVKNFAAKKVIRRIAAAAAYGKLGYAVNVMACFVVPLNKIESAARWLSARSTVSHCYQRKTFDGWPYNLYAMIHAGKTEDVESFVGDFVRRFKITKWVLLPTEKELKKQPVLL